MIRLFAAAAGLVLLSGCGGQQTANDQGAADTSSPPAVSTAPAASGGSAAAAAPAAFTVCLTCHTVGQGEAAKIGPNLFGVYGAKAGSRPGFEYSNAMKNADFTWTEDKLDAYLTAPQKVVPGNKMPFAGMPNEEDREKVIDYLEHLK